VSISILLVQDEARPWSLRMAQAMQRPEVRMVAARGARNKLQDHFQDLQTHRRNKRGWRRQNFWGQVRRSVQAPTPAGDLVLISINHVGIAQRYFGGEIRPRNVDHLTLPAQEKAYGKRAGEFDNLEFGLAPDPERNMQLRPALIESRATEIRRTKKGYKAVRSRIGGVMYWLTRRVVQQEDPTVLPTDRELGDAAEKPVLVFLDRESNRGGSR
jgi:hypothetical protein